MHNEKKTKNKFETLTSALQKCETLAVAFSGGVDSTFLLLVAKEVLGEKVIAITADSPTFSAEEQIYANDFCSQHGIEHHHINLDENSLNTFSHNPPNRCYLCKKIIFSEIQKKANELGIALVADGTNLDDTKDYRPGLLALTELGILSPLKDTGFSKKEIRQALKARNSSVWNKPAFACLASRIPYGEKITIEKLRAIDGLEKELHQLGFAQCRVRHHGTIARIEVSAEERIKFFSLPLMDQVNASAKKFGFLYATLDLGGYQMGSLNQSLER